MTHHTKRVIRITLSTAALGSALLGALAWGMPSASAVTTAVNQHWVPADTFHRFRDSVEHQRERDSSYFASSIRDATRELKVCIRHPEDCK